MSSPAIRVEGLGKRYRLGDRPWRSRRTLGETLVESVRAPFRRSSLRPPREGPAARLAAPGDAHIWALRDVSMAVPQGEVLGVIGRNGAGKSTLLKLLTRITHPTEGQAEIRGRVGSLLEVGTGFHSELTGRENVYLNGAILGMKKSEIDRKFDEIVAFADIGDFLDTPVKRYSSGMQMRLAFAVAAHLEPEIMLVDEVLAVGDAAFQRKCLGKMGDVASAGRTIVFVSHNMAAVQSLCDRVVWLDGGRIVEEGDPGVVVSRYMQTSLSPVTEQVWEDPVTAPGNDKVRLRSVRVRPADGSPADPITVRTPFQIEVEYWNLKPGARLNLCLELYNEQGTLVLSAAPLTETGRLDRPFPVGLLRDVCHVPADFLNNGLHRVQILVVHDHAIIIFQSQDVLIFEVRDAADLRGAWFGNWPGAVRPALRWETGIVEERVPVPASFEAPYDGWPRDGTARP